MLELILSLVIIGLIIIGIISPITKAELLDMGFTESEANEILNRLDKE